MKRSIMCVVSLLVTLGILIYGNIITAEASSEFYGSATTVAIKNHIEKDADFGTYATAQGSCTDGKYAYFAINNGNTTLLKYDVNTWELKSKRSDVNLDHANDMTYNPNENVILVANNTPNFDIISIVDPDTLKVIGQQKIKYKIYSISYSPKYDRYVVGISGTYNFAILDSNFKKIEVFKGYKSGYTRQGSDCDDNYLYFVQSGGGGNLLVIYDWSGRLVDTVGIDKALEIENIFHVKNSIFITFHHYGNFVYRIGISDATSIKFTVRYDANGGEGEMKDTSVVYGRGKKLSKCAFTKEGYTFGGWIIKRDSYNKYYGKKTPYSKNSWLKKDDVYEYTLYGDNTNVSKTTSVGDITAIAFWIADEYRVYYDSNDGNGHIDFDTVGYGEKFKLSENTFTKEGYIFTGWTAQREYDSKIYGYAKKKDKPKWLYPKDVAKKYVFKDEQDVSKLTYDLGVTMTAKWESAFTFSKSEKILEKYIGIDKNVVFPKDKTKVEEIADSAFENIKTVDSVEIPSTINTMGHTVFSGCDNLNVIYFDGKLPENTQKDTFEYPDTAMCYLKTEKEDIFIGWASSWFNYECMKWMCDDLFY